MGIAVFSDIHGNLEALEAILKHAKKNRKVKQIYFLGDAITFGPDSSACLKLLKNSGVECVIGNHEQRMVRYDKAAKTLTYATPAHMKYIFGQLDNDDLSFIKNNMATKLKINYKGVNILFNHYAHDEIGVLLEDYEEFTEPRLSKLFDSNKCDVVFFGHIHKRKIIIDENGKSYVCVGSSGCVKGDKTFYTYFEVNDGIERQFDIYRINVPFNRKKFDEKMNNTPMPGKEKYAQFTFGLEYKGEEK